jgi:hypothetical protein
VSITDIAKQMVKREYDKKLITLPAKFWNLPEYKGRFQLQMRLAAKLIRTYGEEAVQTVIDRETWCWSLAAKKLPDLMEAEASNLNKKKIVEEVTRKPAEREDLSNIPQFRNPIKPKSKLLDE